jgi:outer membrane protein OmpA-like peptidoglycan-associated protein
MYARIALIAALVAVGCKKTPPETPAPEPAPAPAPAPEPAPAAPQFEAGPVIDPITFDSGVTTVKAAEMPIIDKAADILKNGDWKVIVVGLADASGDAEQNKILSQQRADAVAAELTKRIQLPEDRIQVKGIGEKLATGATQSERKVEFVFYKNAGDMPVRQIVMKSGVLEADFRQKREEKAAQ